MKPTIVNKFLNEEKFDKYKANLSVITMEVQNGQEGDFVKSYNTYVAYINHNAKTIECYDWYSQTTSKHINYVAKNYGYKVIGGK